MRKDINIAPEKKNIVAVHFANGLGNFIMLTPALQALAKHFDAKVDIILDKSWQDSRRSSVKDFCDRWKLIREVKEFQDGFDKKDYRQLFYVAHGENCEALSYFRENAGYEADHINWRASKINEVDYYMDQVYKLGYKGSVPPLAVSETEGIQTQNYPGTRSNEPFRIGFCNGLFAGSKWKWERKGWPYFPELTELLFKYFPNVLVLLFGKGEREVTWAEKIEGLYKKIHSYVGNNDIGLTIKLMKKLHLFITTDTGLMHIADALKIPTIILIGPTLISKNGPYNKEHRIARSPLRCAPCQQSPRFHTCNDWQCMKELRPEMVMSVIRKYIYDMVREGHPLAMDDKKKEIREYLLR